MDDDKAIPREKSSMKGHSNPFDERIMLCSVIVILTAVLILFYLRTYVRWVSNRNHTSRRHHEAVHSLFSVTAGNDNEPKGLDSSTLKSLPKFVYNTRSLSQMQECPVCLSEFQENEKVRVLPKCKHTFHVDCIDLWLHSHSNCALCRAPIQSDNNTETTVDVTIVLVGEQGGSEPILCEKNEHDIGCSSSGRAESLSSEECLRKPAGIIVVELPSEVQTHVGSVDLGLGLGLQRVIGSKSQPNWALSRKHSV